MTGVTLELAELSCSGCLEGSGEATRLTQGELSLRLPCSGLTSTPACCGGVHMPIEKTYAPSELHLPVSVPVRQSFRHATFLVNQPPPPQRVGNPQTPLPLPFQRFVPGSVCPVRGPLPLHAAQISQHPPNPDPAHLSMHQAARVSRTGTGVSPSSLLPATR